jgi:hypothetical protein
MAASNANPPSVCGQPRHSLPSLHRLPAIKVALSFALIAIASLPFAGALPVSETAREVFALGKLEPKPADDPSLWLYLTSATVLVLLGGVFAGLTIAYVPAILFFGRQFYSTIPTAALHALNNNDAFLQDCGAVQQQTQLCDTS